MKIAYDISILGQGYINPKSRTGIYRVVEALFLELIKIPDINLTPLALNQLTSIWDIVSTNLCLQTLYPEFKQNFQLGCQSRCHLLPIYQNAVELQKKIINKSLIDSSWLYKPALSLQIPFKLLAKLDVISKIKLQSFDVYHSPFLPKPIDENNNISSIITIYDLIPVLYPDKLTTNINNKFAAILKSINIQQDFITCISDNTKKDFCEYTGMDADRVFVTPLAADKHFYPVNNLETIQTIGKKYNIPEAPYLLSLCTLEPRKNLQLLIRCFTQIIESNPSLDINLVLVGVSGWKNNEIFQEAVKNPQVKSRIIFTGFVPDADLSPLYSGATAFVYPSLYEGFGLPPLEAMQCGTPVITSNTSSLPEVVGDAGIMIDPKREDDLCQALLDIINDYNLRDTLSQRGIERAKLFSWEKCAKQTIEVYKIAAQK